MLKLTLTIAAIITCVLTNAQETSRFKVIINAHHNLTLYDYYKKNNPVAIGLGAQALYHNSIVKPFVDASVNLYNMSIQKVDPNYHQIPVQARVLAGAAFMPGQFYTSVAAGIASDNLGTNFAIQPSVGFLPIKPLLICLSYLNVFDRWEKHDQGSLVLSVGFIPQKRKSSSGR